MMKRELFVLLLLLNYQYLFAQSSWIKIRYDFHYKPDSSLGNKEIDEKMVLWIKPDSVSYFMSEMAYVKDSVKLISLKRSISLPEILATLKPYPTGNVKHSVKKTYLSNQMTYNEDVGTIYSYVEPLDTIQWKLLPDKQVIHELPCQKATTTFGGKEWTAWFTSKIQLTEGPYKFYGLPGLLVQIEDNLHTVRYTMASIKKTASPPYIELFNRASTPWNRKLVEQKYYDKNTRPFETFSSNSKLTNQSMSVNGREVTPQEMDRMHRAEGGVNLIFIENPLIQIPKPN